MANMQKQVKLLGDVRTFEISEQVKKYTLRDVGFMPTNKGGFQLERALDIKSPFNHAIKFKMTVDAELTGMKMAIVTADGLHNINIFKEEMHQPQRDQLNFIIDELVERQIIKVI